MLIIAKDISYYTRRYADVFAEVLRETETRYYVRPIEGQAKGAREKYVEKADVITTNATPEMWEAIKQADEEYKKERQRMERELIEAHRAAVERILAHAPPVPGGLTGE